MLCETIVIVFGTIQLREDTFVPFLCVSNRLARLRIRLFQVLANILVLKIQGKTRKKTGFYLHLSIIFRINL